MRSSQLWTLLVHNCEDRFHIHVFICSSNIWLSYIPSRLMASFFLPVTNFESCLYGFCRVFHQCCCTKPHDWHCGGANIKNVQYNNDYSMIACHYWYSNPLHPNISMHILHTVLYTFLKVLTRRICLTIENSLNGDHFL